MKTLTTEKLTQTSSLPVAVTQMARAELDLKVAQEVESLLLAEAGQLQDRRAEVERAWHRCEYALSEATTATDVRALHERKAQLEQEQATIIKATGTLNQKGENARQAVLDKHQALLNLQGHAAYLRDAIPRQGDVIKTRKKLMLEAEGIAQHHRETLRGMESHRQSLELELAEIVGSVREGTCE